MKTCRECGDLLEVGDNWSEYSKEHCANICTPCSTLAKKRLRKQRKLEAIEYLGGKCIDCNIAFKHKSVYEFHHLDPTKKEGNPSDYFRGRSKEALFKELDKCVLLCANCHRVRHAIENE